MTNKVTLLIKGEISKVLNNIINSAIKPKLKGKDKLDNEKRKNKVIYIGLNITNPL